MSDIFEEYIQRLIDNHNYGANEYTNSLKSREDYYAFLRPTYELCEKRELSCAELYRELLDKSFLKEKIERFIEVGKAAPGMVLEVGTLQHHDILVIGDSQELNDDGHTEVLKMQKDSIFDLSSITKVFSCVAMLKLIDLGIIDFDEKIAEIDRRFIHLSDVTVEDLLSFRTPLKTADRIENALTFEDAERLIFEMMPDYTQTRLYTDMGAIVLKYVMESRTGMPLYELVRKYILDPCDMWDTVLTIESRNMHRVVSNNFERRIRDNTYTVINDVTKGTVNDGKARKLERFNRQLYGHAGLFSTAEDMGKFARGLMSGMILKPKIVNKIGRNCTGKRLDNGGFSQFHGFLCYSKNPVAVNSEVNHWLSGNAFALGGYTGNQLTIDYRNQLYIFMASNRCHNRITSVSGTAEGYVSGEEVAWPDGKKYICNKRYAYDRDDSVINPAIELAMQYRLMEYLLERRK
jgi:CubicO group peptidase (beta-lactamase class C family)